MTGWPAVGRWFGLLCELALYAFGVAFVLFFLYMAWMILEDIIEKD